MKSRLAATIATIGILVALPSPASANQVFCTGNVLSVWSNASGNLYISSSWRLDHTQICNLRQEWQGIPADTCLVWAARLDAAAAMNRMVTVSYFNISTTCATLDRYEYSPAPLYVMLLNN